MKQAFFILLIFYGLVSCNHKTKKFNNDNSLPDAVHAKQPITGDSIYKIGSYLFTANKNARFEFVKKGETAKNNTKGDTLYYDKDSLLLGDINEITGAGIFKRFSFRSKFQDLKAGKIYTGKLAKPNFSTDPAAKHFITRITDGCKNSGVNFAGHYTIIEWGCGLLCQEMALVDRITGEIIFSRIPFDTADGHSGALYAPGSRMLIINTEALGEFYDYEPGYILHDHWRKPTVYEMKKGRFRQIE